MPAYGFLKINEFDTLDKHAWDFILMEYLMSFNDF